MKNRKSRSRSKSRTNRLSFERLEPRQLLAGDVMGSHQVDGVLPAGANILVNGDFQSLTNADDNFFADNEVTAWNTKGINTQLNILTYSAGYGKVLDLDSTTSEFDRVYQDVSTEANTEYLVTFDFRNHPADHPGTTPRSYDFEVWWNGSLVAVYTGTDIWQTGSVRVTSSSDATTELLFCEVPEDGAPGGDGLGAMLDNVRVFKATPLEISNPGFENATSDTIFNQSYEVEGWGAMGTDPAERLLKIVPSGENATATEGDRYLNLDVTETKRDIVYRDLETTAGVSYYVTFDMRVDGSGLTDSDELRVRWKDAWAGTFHGDSDWQNYALMLTADAAQTRLTFLEPSTGDGSGPLIDNVRIYAVLQNDLAIDANGAESGTSGSHVFVPGAGAKNIGAPIVVTHPSSDRISSATITLNGVVDGSNEIIAVSSSLIPLDQDNNPKITVFNYRPETRQLQLIGAATVAEYQTLLRSLAYFNSSDSVATSDRTVVVEVVDDDLPPLDSTSSASIQVAVETDQAAIDDAILRKFAADNSLNAVPVSEGLYVVIDELGTGINPTINSTVRVKYNGKFLELNSQNQIVEGESFDFSSDEGITFPLSNVIRGWQLGIPQFKTGGFGKLLIPSHLAYGEFGTSGIPGNSVLVFDVELKQII